jgi:hypothetical protein
MCLTCWLPVCTDLTVEGKPSTPGSITLEGKIQLVAFCLFEVRRQPGGLCHC